MWMKSVVSLRPRYGVTFSDVFLFVVSLKVEKNHTELCES